MKKEFVGGKEALKSFEKVMKSLFKASKPPKHEPKKREKNGKD